MNKFGIQPDFESHLAEIFCNEVCGFTIKSPGLLKELFENYENAVENDKDELYSRYIRGLSTIICGAAARGNLKRLQYFLNKTIIYEKLNNSDIKKYLILPREVVFDIIWLLANNTVSNKDCVPLTRQVIIFLSNNIEII